MGNSEKFATFRGKIMSGESIQELEELINQAYDPNLFNESSIPLIFFSVSRPEVVKFLLDKGVNPHQVSPVDQTTLLHWAIRHPKTVALLLEHDVDPNVQNPETGYTVLHTAIRTNLGEYMDTIEALLNDPRTRTDLKSHVSLGSKTAWELAIDCDNKEVMQLLVSREHAQLASACRV